MTKSLQLLAAFLFLTRMVMAVGNEKLGKSARMPLSFSLKNGEFMGSHFNAVHYPSLFSPLTNRNRLTVMESGNPEEEDVELEENEGLGAKLISKSQAVLRAAQPFCPNSDKIIQYFEVRFEKMESGKIEVIEIGLAKPNLTPFSVFTNEGILWHGRHSSVKEFAKKFEGNISIGCGLFLDSDSGKTYIFYAYFSTSLGGATLLGKLIEIPTTTNKLYPTISIKGEGIELKANFFEENKTDKRSKLVTKKLDEYLKLGKVIKYTEKKQ